jgi:hypothetical protein
MKASEGIQKLDAESFECMLKDVMNLETGKRKLTCKSGQQIPEKIACSEQSQRYRGVFILSAFRVLACVLLAQMLGRGEMYRSIPFCVRPVPWRSVF